MSDRTDLLPSVAFFYPEPFWLGDDGSVIKNLLPFFDEVAILLPNYMYGRHRDASPWLTGPLEDAGLLRVLEPGEFIDQTMTRQLFGIMSDLLVAGAFDQLKVDDSPYGYHELSRTRLGWNADVELSTLLTDELIRRRLGSAEPRRCLRAASSGCPHHDPGAAVATRTCPWSEAVD